MKIISHRGNLNGKNKKYENNPSHISDLLKNNLNVEVDVWVLNKKIYLGHDKAQYLIKKDFLLNNNLWCHAKNLNALLYMKKINVKNFFWHQNDFFTLTSSGYIWTFPKNETTKKSIIVDLEENWKEKKYNAFGVCVDYFI